MYIFVAIRVYICCDTCIYLLRYVYIIVAIRKYIFVAIRVYICCDTCIYSFVIHVSTMNTPLSSDLMYQLYEPFDLHLPRLLQREPQLALTVFAFPFSFHNVIIRRALFQYLSIVSTPLLIATAVFLVSRETQTKFN